jgi:hypothetical protein
VRRIIVSVAFALIAESMSAASHSGPQPFLLFRVDFGSQPPVRHRDAAGREIGTLSAHQDFRHFDASGDGLDSVAMHATLLRKTPTGFHFSWLVVERLGGREILHSATEEFVP